MDKDTQQPSEQEMPGFEMEKNVSNMIEKTDKKIQKIKNIAGLISILVAIIGVVITIIVAFNTPSAPDYQGAYDLIEEKLSDVPGWMDCEALDIPFDFNEPEMSQENLDECLTALSEYKNNFSKLQQTNIGSDEDLKESYDAVMTAYEKMQNQDKKNAETYKKMRIYFDFYQKARDIYRYLKGYVNTSLSKVDETTIKNAADILINSGYQDLADYGKEWQEVFTKLDRNTGDFTELVYFNNGTHYELRESLNFIFDDYSDLENDLWGAMIDLSSDLEDKLASVAE